MHILFLMFGNGPTSPRYIILVIVLLAQIILGFPSIQLWLPWHVLGQIILGFSPSIRLWLTECVMTGWPKLSWGVCFHLNPAVTAITLLFVYRTHAVSQLPSPFRSHVSYAVIIYHHDSHAVTSSTLKTRFHVHVCVIVTRNPRSCVWKS